MGKKLARSRPPHRVHAAMRAAAASSFRAGDRCFAAAHSLSSASLAAAAAAISASGSCLPRRLFLIPPGVLARPGPLVPAHFSDPQPRPPAEVGRRSAGRRPHSDGVARAPGDDLCA